MPAPRRPGVLSTLGWITVVVVIAASGLLTFVLITSETGPLGLVAGVALSAVPVFPVIAVYLWLDRYEAEPKSLLAFAFGWGAAVATFGAMVINTASSEAIRASGGDPSSTAVLVAPVVEESLKGMAILLILLARRREFDGVVDGIVYAGMVGIGFAFVEDVLYLGRTLAEYGGWHLAVIFVVRCVASPFAHPLFTAATGIGIGIAARSGNPLVKVLSPVLGWVVAVFLHGLWNLSASAQFGSFVALYVVVQVPLFIGFITLAVFARRREGRLIAAHLAGYAGAGWLAPAEVGMLASVRERRDARGWAARVGGPGARRAMRDFQELGSELAFLRERMNRGTAPPDAGFQEQALLAAMSARRAGFVPGLGPR
jgi:protease PrsW